MDDQETRSETTRSVRRATVLRATAGVGAVFCAWIAVDLLATGTGSAAPGFDFLLFWGVPFATAAVFLAWYAARGGRSTARRAARAGCLVSFALGAVVFLLLLGSPLLLPWDALRGAVAAFLYAPLAATVGLAIGLLGHHVRQRSG